MESTLDLQLLAPPDWRVLRAARLQALLDSPHAFMSSYAHESGWGPARWLRAFDTATWIVAHDGENLIGLASSVREPELCHATRRVRLGDTEASPTRCVPRSHSRASRDRTSDRCDRAAALGARGQSRRLASYEALGFEPTGERQFLPPFGPFERRFRLDTKGLLES